MSEINKGNDIIQRIQSEYRALKVHPQPGPVGDLPLVLLCACVLTTASCVAATM